MALGLSSGNINIARLMVSIAGDWSGLRKQLRQSQTGLQKFAKVSSQIGFVGVPFVAAPIVGAFAAVVKASTEFEDAFVKVRKTVNASDSEIEKVRQTIIGLSNEMPATAAELSEIAAVGGQANIPLDSMADYIKTVAMLMETTGVESEDLAFRLGKLKQFSPEESFASLGNVLTHLGNEFPSLEKDILIITSRFAGFGAQFDTTGAKALAWGNALASLSGLGPEALATSLQRLFRQVEILTRDGGKKGQLFAQVMGDSLEKVRVAFEKDASGTVQDFINRLAGLAAAGVNVSPVMDELIGKEARLSSATTSLVGGVDVLNRSFSEMERQMIAQDATAREYGKFVETLSNQFQVLQNRFATFLRTGGAPLIDVLRSLVAAAQALVTVGLIPMAEWFAALDPEISRAVVIIALIMAGVAGLSLAMGSAAVSISALSWGFTGLGLSMLPTIGIALAVIAGLLLISKVAYDGYKAFKKWQSGAKEAETESRGLTDALSDLGQRFTDAYNAARDSVIDPKQFEGMSLDAGPVIKDLEKTRSLLEGIVSDVTDLKGVEGVYRDLADAGIEYGNTMFEISAQLRQGLLSPLEAAQARVQALDIAAKTFAGSGLEVAVGVTQRLTAELSAAQTELVRLQNLAGDTGVAFSDALLGRTRFDIVSDQMSTAVSKIRTLSNQAAEGNRDAGRAAEQYADELRSLTFQLTDASILNDELRERTRGMTNAAQKAGIAVNVVEDALRQLRESGVATTQSLQEMENLLAGLKANEDLEKGLENAAKSADELLKKLERVKQLEASGGDITRSPVFQPAGQSALDQFKSGLGSRRSDLASRAGDIQQQMTPELQKSSPQAYSKLQAELDIVVNDAAALQRLDEFVVQTETIFDTVASSISGAFSTAVTGIIQGTTTVQEAFQQMGVNILLSFLQTIVQMVSQWLVGQLTMLAIHAATSGSMQALSWTTSASMQAAGTASGTSWIASAYATLAAWLPVFATMIANAASTAATMIASALSTAWGYIASAAAGAASAMASIPYVGPFLAVAAAAAIVGGLGALVAKIAGAEQGALVPGDMPIYAHKGEMILPRRLSTGVQDLVSSGFSRRGDREPDSTSDNGPAARRNPRASGDTFIIYAQDAKSFEPFLARNGRAVARVIRQQYGGHGAATRLSRRRSF